MKSQRIAVAGGTGGIGRHVVEGLLGIKDQHSLEIIVLSRSAADNITFNGATAPVLVVDYNDPASIEKALHEYQIDTLISTIMTPTPEPFIATQANLLTAALAVPSIRRFAPSEFGHDAEYLQSIPLCRMKLDILGPLKKAKAERPNSFEFTRFFTGTFMNFLGAGNPKPNGEKALGHLKPFPWIFDLANRKADIPGDGQVKEMWTTAEDVGKFVAAATQLERWEEHSDMVGEMLPLDEVLEIAESLCGTKFDVKYNTRDELLARMDAPGTLYNLYLELFVGMIDGNCDAKRPFNLNELVDVKPMRVREYLEKWWGP